MENLKEWSDDCKKNPRGRPKDSAITELKFALSQFKHTHNKTYIQMAIEKSVDDSALMVAILKKILPDLTEDKSMVQAIKTYLIFPDRNKVESAPMKVVEAEQVKEEKLKIV